MKIVWVLSLALLSCACFGAGYFDVPDDAPGVFHPEFEVVCISMADVTGNDTERCYDAMTMNRVAAKRTPRRQTSVSGFWSR